MKKTGFVWKIYLLAFAVYLFQGARNILVPNSFLYMYYHTLMAFHSFFVLPYILALAQILFNIACLVPLFLYVFGIDFLFPRFWQWVLVLRVIFDLTGHMGEFLNAQAIYYANKEWFFSTILLGLIMTIPSYGACFQYAFTWKNLQQKILP